MGSTVILALCLVAFASSVPIDDKLSTAFGKVAAKIEAKGLQFPEIKQHSEEEWVNLVKSIRNSGFLKNYEDKEHRIVNVTKTGKYENDDGVKADFRGNTTIYYTFEKDIAKRTTFDVYAVKDDEGETYMVSRSYTIYYGNGDEKNPEFDAAGVMVGARVKAKGEDSYWVLSHQLEIMEGGGREVNGTYVCDASSLAVYNVSDKFSVSESDIQVLLKKGESSIKMEGGLISNTVPLNPSFRLSSSSVDTDTLIRVFKNSGASAGEGITVTEGRFSGEFTTGEKGTYTMDSGSSTQPITGGKMVNTTISLTGEYKVDNQTAFENSIPFYHTMSEFATGKPLFLT